MTRSTEDILLLNMRIVRKKELKMARYIYPNTSLEPDVVIFFLDESVCRLIFKNTSYTHTHLSELSVLQNWKMEGYFIFSNY